MSMSTFPGGSSDPAPTYQVVKLPEVEGTLGIFEVVKSYPPTVYTIMATNDGVSCSCPDYWKWAVDRKVKNYACKHIKMVAEKVTSQSQPSEGSKGKAANRKEKAR